MPTRRAFIFLFLALGLYMLANQTQVGWVYLMVNGLVGLLLALLLYSRGILKGIRGERAFRNLASSRSGAPADDPLATPDEFFEDDPIEITLSFKQAKLKPVFMVSGEELCPFAPPTDQSQPFFIPALFKGQSLQLPYQTDCYRRGQYSFSSLKLRSKGPFNFFSARQTLAVPAEISIYPYYYPLKRLRLLESQGLTDRHAARSGASSEVIGTREYRSGDSLRQVHWRSTARAGKLVVKEFADQDQLTMAVVLDLSAGSSLGTGKFSTFETAVRLAASFGYYATQQNIPFHLVGQAEQGPAPALALSWWGILNYLARIDNNGQTPLATVLHQLPPVPFVVVLVSRADEALSRALAALPQQGRLVLVVHLQPEETMAETTPLRPAPGLEVRQVTPHNWEAMLEAL